MTIHLPPSPADELPRLLLRPLVPTEDRDDVDGAIATAGKRWPSFSPLLKMVPDLCAPTVSTRQRQRLWNWHWSDFQPCGIFTSSPAPPPAWRAPAPAAEGDAQTFNLIYFGPINSPQPLIPA